MGYELGEGEGGLGFRGVKVGYEMVVGEDGLRDRVGESGQGEGAR